MAEMIKLVQALLTTIIIHDKDIQTMYFMDDGSIEFEVESILDPRLIIMIIMIMFLLDELDRCVLVNLIPHARLATQNPIAEV
jgi:hypothetical protein